MNQQKSNVVSLKESLTEAEKKAKERDLFKRKLVEDIIELTGEEYYIGKVKKKNSKVRFVQMVQLNVEYLRKLKYLTSEEKVFLFDIQTHIGFDSNCIVENISSRSPNPLTQKAISEVLGTSKSKVSRIVNSLVKKGVIARTESGIEGNNVRSYSLFINPHILISGDKQDINPTLKAMFKKPMSNIEELKELPIKFF